MPSTPLSTASHPPDLASPTVAELASSTRAGRNRAVDFYRAVAMGAVALGHWAAIHLSRTDEGIVAGNALEFAPSMSWITWLFQVMPLFFVVGGFSSAMSLDAHTRSNGRPQDWVAARLRRMLAPTVTLAVTWLTVLAVAALLGVGDLAAAGAMAGAIPLWFLANYTIDTAIAPTVLPWFRRNPRLVAGLGVAVFVAFELVRFAGHTTIAQVNWVLGWLLFQVAGFAWRDGLLPTGRRLVAWAGGLWCAALAAVTVGPYPTSMVHFPGIENSPTHSPSVALLLFGGAYSATALAAAPAVSAWLERHPRAWAATIAANANALTVYLWHFTAAAAAGAVLYAAGMLPTAEVNTVDWWVQKTPLMALSAVFLVGIVAAVGRVERRALLAPRTPWAGGHLSIIAVAGVVSASVKIWTMDHPMAIVAGAGVLVVVWFGALASPGEEH